MKARFLNSSRADPFREELTRFALEGLEGGLRGVDKKPAKAIRQATTSITLKTTIVDQMKRRLVRDTSRAIPGVQRLRAREKKSGQTFYNIKELIGIAPDSISYAQTDIPKFVIEGDRSHLHELSPFFFKGENEISRHLDDVLPIYNREREEIKMMEEVVDMSEVDKLDYKDNNINDTIEHHSSAINLDIEDIEDIEQNTSPVVQNVIITEMDKEKMKEDQESPKKVSMRKGEYTETCFTSLFPLLSDTPKPRQPAQDRRQKKQTSVSFDKLFDSINEETISFKRRTRWSNRHIYEEEDKLLLPINHSIQMGICVQQWTDDAHIEPLDIFGKSHRTIRTYHVHIPRDIPTSYNDEDASLEGIYPIEESHLPIDIRDKIDARDDRDIDLPQYESASHAPRDYVTLQDIITSLPNTPNASLLDSPVQFAAAVLKWPNFSLFWEGYRVSME